MSDPDRIRLRHMIDAATEALSFVRGRQQSDLAGDRQFSLAVIKEIEIIGEAASKISIETREQYPNVPWAAIVGMRNRLIHAYAEVDLEVIWAAVSVDLPDPLKTLKAILG